MPESPAPRDWQQIERLYHDALAQEPAGREAFLAQACHGDAALAAEVRSLLDLESAAGAFLTRPALEQVAKTIPPAVAGTLTGRQIHGYELRSLLGAGGMGEVYLARDLRLGRDVALKILRRSPDNDAGYLQRFEDEARSASVLNHPNIVTIYGVGEDGDISYIAMERVLGRTLREIIASADLAVPAVLDLAVQLADALAVAHGRGIVHRDLKPDNVMVTPDGLLKVLDFGIAKRDGSLDKHASVTAVTTIRSLETEVGTILGTVGYMSPEQAAGLRASPASDQFSFGAMLYEMLTGKRAFERSTKVGTLDAIKHEQPVALQSLNANVTPSLRRLVERCLQKAPADRFAQTQEIATSLRSIRAQLSGEGMTRRRALALGAAAAVTVSTGSAAWTLWPRGQRVRSLAVLPFKNELADDETEPLCLGLTTTLIERIGPLASIKVAPKSLVANFRDSLRDPVGIGREIGVESVLTGSISLRAGILEISATLVEVATGRHLWLDRYSRPFADVMTVQDEIATAIVDDGIRLRLTDVERRQMISHETDVPEAYELFHRARALMNVEGLNEERQLLARDLFEKAIEADPRFARAYSGLAGAYNGLSVEGYVRPAETRPQIVANLLEAKARDPDLNDAHGEEATYLFAYEWDWDGAERAWRRATRGRGAEMDTNLWLVRSLHQWALGRADVALAYIREARARDRMSAYLTKREADTCLHLGQFDRAAELYEEVIGIQPHNPRPQFGIAEVRRAQGRYADAIEARRRAQAAMPGMAEVLATARGREGYERIERKTAELMLAGMDERAQTGAWVDPYDYARTYAMLGQRREALRHLEAALVERAPSLVFLKVDRSLDSLRTDPRFRAVMARVGLP